ncbi:MAG: hypothetical protein J6I64_03385 [Lachnospiraceae bacterium]|nr:hypothetical protein [Lachnospiraceae bacterium]
MQKWMWQKKISLRMPVLIAAVLAVTIIVQQAYHKVDSQWDHSSTAAIPDTTEGTITDQIESTTYEEKQPEYDGLFHSLENGDSYYTPAQIHAVTDAHSSVLYYDNLLLVFTDSDLSQEEIDQISQMVGGQTMGVVDGGIHAFQILVEDLSGILYRDDRSAYLLWI